MLRQPFKIGLFAFALFGACSHNQGKPASPQLPVSLPTQLVTTTTANSAPPAQPADPWRLTATRTHDGHSASGSVLLRRPVAVDAGSSPHLKLAGARAWIALGEQRVAAEDWAGAIACARAGLAELGSEYAGRRVLDHTDMKLYVAEDRIKEGRLDYAAEIMLHQLTIRTRLYIHLHADAIAE